MLFATVLPGSKTDMNDDTRLTVPAQVMSRVVGDETVLLDLASGTYFGLDGVGQRIWASVAGGASLGETAALIATEYAVDADRAKVDVIAFAGDLVARGLLAE